jgi:hypothetical protein
LFELCPDEYPEFSAFATNFINKAIQTHPEITNPNLLRPGMTPLITDPMVKYDRKTSNKRIRSNGEIEQSARNTRRATAKDIEELKEQQSLINTAYHTIQPVATFEVRSAAVTQQTNTNNQPM